MHAKMNGMVTLRAFGLSIVAAVLVTVVAIYFTPLKWIPILEPTINDVSAAAFYEEYRANPEKYVFIDVRPESAYANLHALGSLSMPLHTLYDARHVLPKRGKEIVLICSGGRASGVGYSYLQHFGFFNIRRIEGGIENWVLEGLPTEGIAGNGSSVL